MNVDKLKLNKKKSSIKKNFIFNIVYQVLLLIVPLIVTPYISRVLLPEGVGQYSYSISIITYFTLFAALGFGLFAQREIAKFQDDQRKRTIIFWEIIICRSLSVFLTMAVNLVLAFTKVYGDDSLLLLILNINIFAILFDVSFFFQGMENFKAIVLRNAVVRVLGVVAIFLFVKTPDDVWIYALINSSMLIVGNLSLWTSLPRYLVKVSVRELRPLRHLPGTLRLFIPTIVISIYIVLDKTLIGIITQSDAQNGFYESADKIVKIALTVVTCLGTVTIPRNSSEYAKGNIEKVKANVQFAVKYVWFLGAALLFGLSAVTFNFNSWFFGPGYEDVNWLIIVLSGLSLSLGLNNVLGLQYLIPTGRENIFTISVVIGAVVNVVLNLVLIPFFAAMGAAIATLIAETVILIFQLIYLRKEIEITCILFGGIKNIIAGGVMFASILPLSLIWDQTILFSVIIILLGALIYFVMLLLLRDKFVLLLLRNIFAKFRKQKEKNDDVNDDKYEKNNEKTDD